MLQINQILTAFAFLSMLAVAQQQPTVLLSPVPFLKPDGTIPAPGQETGVFYDVKNSQAVVLYRPVEDGGGDYGAPVKKFAVPLRNQIEPVIASNIHRNGSQYIYTFTVSDNNGSN